MNSFSFSFFKKCLGVGLVLQLAVWMVAAQTQFNLDSLPLWFEAGQGGVGGGQFVAHGRDSQITISREGAQFAMGQAGLPVATARMEFVGANGMAEIVGGAELPGRINRLKGNDPEAWQTGLAAFGQVRVTGLYPGIDLVYYGDQQHLEYDFDLAPGARPEAVAIRFSGMQKVRVNAQGELVVQVGGRDIIQDQPVAYQTSGSGRRPIQVSYQQVDAQTVAFKVGNYDLARPLVIDPVLSYSTFFGGNRADTARSVAYATNDDSVYIVGQTLSTAISGTLRFATPGAFQTNFQGGGTYGDAFVAKFHDLSNSNQLINLATNLVYCTYLGGSADDGGFSLAVDSTGHAFVTGVTFSTDFPVTNYIIFQRTNGQVFNGSTNQGAYASFYSEYSPDAFVSELDTNGAHLIFSTYLGGADSDLALGLALDPAGNVFVTGYTSSTNFPVTTNAWQPKFAACYNHFFGFNAFVAEIAAGGKTLNYSTYLGGTNLDAGFSIAYNNGYVAAAGVSYSSNFPTLNAIKQSTLVVSNYVAVQTNYYDGTLLNGSTNNINNNLVTAYYTGDAFVTLFPVSGSTLGTPVYSTFLGGTNTDLAYGVALDPFGAAYVVGGTTSTNFPYTFNPGQALLPSFTLTKYTGLLITNAFLTKLEYVGGKATITYSQVFGGYGQDVAYGVALDATGNVFVVGSTSSLTNVLANPTNLIGALSFTNSGQVNGFIDAFAAGFSNVLYAADFGSLYQDYGYGIAVDPNDSVYIVGLTYANQGLALPFPVYNAWEPVPPDNYNGFLAKILFQNPPVPALKIAPTATNLLVTWSPFPLAQSATNVYFLQSNSNLVMGMVFTNIVINTNVTPYSTNVAVVTNLASSTSWVAVTENPIVTNTVIGGYTNPVYQYPVFVETNSMKYYRLKGLIY
jgi:hypothetical protein